MRRTSIVLVVLSLLSLTLFMSICGGCSGVDAKAAMSKEIDGNVGLSVSRECSTQPVSALADNAAAFNRYVEVATVNPFAYWFGPKLMLVTPGFYQSLQKAADLSNQNLRRATTRPTMTQIPEWLDNEAIWMTDVQAKKNATH